MVPVGLPRLAFKVVNGVIVFVGGSDEFCANDQLARAVVVDVIGGLAAPDVKRSAVAQLYDVNNIGRAVGICVVDADDGDFCDLSSHFSVFLCWTFPVPPGRVFGFLPPTFEDYTRSFLVSTFNFINRKKERTKRWTQPAYAGESSGSFCSKIRYSILQ